MVSCQTPNLACCDELAGIPAILRGLFSLFTAATASASPRASLTRLDCSFSSSCLVPGPKAIGDWASLACLRLNQYSALSGLSAGRSGLPSLQALTLQDFYFTNAFPEGAFGRIPLQDLSLACCYGMGGLYWSLTCLPGLGSQESPLWLLSVASIMKCFCEASTLPVLCLSF